MLTKIEFTILATMLIALFLINIIGILDPFLFIVNLILILFFLGFIIYLMIKPESHAHKGKI